jgi:hypothetical protein
MPVRSGEDYREYKIEKDQQNKNTIHDQVNPHIGFILFVQIF